MLEVKIPISKSLVTLKPPKRHVGVQHGSQGIVEPTVNSVFHRRQKTGKKNRTALLIN